MSTVKSDNYLDGFGGTTATINGITPINAAGAQATDIGVDQTWQAFLVNSPSAERVPNYSYQNNTGKPIMVSIRGVCTSSSNQSYVQISDDNVDWVSVGSLPKQYYYVFSNFIVPNGNYYRVNGNSTLYNWAELR